MKTQIIGVLGLGIFGQTIATELSSFGQDVIALDNNATTIDYLADQVTKAAVGDITDIEFLRSAGIDTCDSVIIATGEHLESSALALLQCKKLGIKNIIAKAMNNNYEEVLYGMGANWVITPERSTAKELASNILRYNISNVFHLEDDVALIELKIPIKSAVNDAIKTPLFFFIFTQLVYTAIVYNVVSVEPIITEATLPI